MWILEFASILELLALALLHKIGCDHVTAATGPNPGQKRPSGDAIAGHENPGPSGTNHRAHDGGC
jgi:hypothetical protein